ncbi:PREDICTED: protein NBR1 homolog isoform X3 [Ipomoea nil]|uniref:protein NBR1 homolog isoform X3 n=1 Tax=Ipomoea nil TaxID=35883 RepID=UPI0009009229|nr:PREDICTED: protein NBR1 homolog isoform X3 [Ipomoea nil]
MDTSIVIKVKYGETLRRFNAGVVDEKLALDIDQLREKILYLFNLSPDVQITLTYIDEDDDVVTLGDNEDLKDVVKQELDPLRITVKLNSERSGRPSSRSSGSSTPLRSPSMQPTSQNMNAGVSELLKAVPEPVRETLIKLSADLASKATSSAPPVLSELVEAFSKVGLSYLNQPQETQSKNESGSQEQPSGNACGVTECGPRVDDIPSEVFLDTTANKMEAIVNEVLKPSSEASLKTSGPNPTKVPEGDSSSGGSLRKMSRGDFGSSGPQPRLSFTGGCPFSGVPTADNPFSPLPVPFDVPPKGSHSHSVGNGTIFHKGVRCDGCGVHPITGPRFKSKVKDDYDLCSICFAETGSSAQDYIRIDRPVNYRHPWSFRGLSDHHARMRSTAPPHMFRGIGVKPSRPKLDSRFIQDVNILDGTIIAPLTQFTKIWRMRNNGNFVWPQGTQLVWIGGDRLSDAISVELEITAAGLPVEHELDVAVDFVAPNLPGRYVSYWRMASPSGQKFGQRVWVLIQVATSTMEPVKKPVPENLRGLNLNLPPASSSSIGIPEMINVNPEPLVEESHREPNVSSKSAELVEPVVEGTNSMKDQEVNFPINDSLFVGLDSTAQPAPHLPPPPPVTTGGSSISYPVVDLSNVEPAVAPARPPPPPHMNVDKPSEDVTDSNEVELSLLKELEAMGFKQVDLNKEILRMNEYDLQQSVDDLCGVSEWDPILEELEEMGFCDKEVNKKLLMKNGGSIKRVVMDLISGEK